MVCGRAGVGVVDGMAFCGAQPFPPISYYLFVILFGIRLTFAKCFRNRPFVGVPCICEVKRNRSLLPPHSHTAPSLPRLFGANESSRAARPRGAGWLWLILHSQTTKNYVFILPLLALLMETIKVIVI